MGLGRYATAEQDVHVASLAGLRGGVRGVVYCHGAARDATSCRDYTNYGTLHLVNALAEHFPVLSVDAGGPLAFGNATAVARVGDAVSHLQGTLNATSGTVLLVGASMGALSCLNYAKAHSEKVAAVVGVIPALDLNDIVVNDRAGLGPSVDAAYGGAYSEATHGATYNPATYAATFTTPTRLYYASDDTTAIPGAVTAFDTACGVASAVSLGALGHTEAAIDAAPRDSIVQFLAQYA
jgi:pimeloyl-ACP methyl ester carboxylesterase